MHSLRTHHRTLRSLVGALACAAALLGNVPAALAGFSLSGDNGVVGKTGQSSERLALTTPADADNLAAYLPAASENQPVDLSVDSTAGAAPATASRQTPAEIPSAPTPADKAEVDCFAALSAPSNSASSAAGASAPPGSVSAGAPAALHDVSQSPTDLQVTGWLQDASRLNLPKSMPHTLLRPPQV